MIDMFYAFLSIFVKLNFVAVGIFAYIILSQHSCKGKG